MLVCILGLLDTLGVNEPGGCHLFLDPGVFREKEREREREKEGRKKKEIGRVCSVVLRCDMLYKVV